MGGLDLGSMENAWDNGEHTDTLIMPFWRTALFSSQPSAARSGLRTHSSSSLEDRSLHSNTHKLETPPNSLAQNR